MQYVLSGFRMSGRSRGLVFDKDGNVNITDQAYADVLQFMVDTAGADYTPCQILFPQQPQSLRSFLQMGKTAMQLNWSHQYPAAVEALERRR